jgi:hypothetical protein
MPNNRSRLIKEILMGTLVLTNSSLTRRYGPSVGSDVNLVDQAGTYLIPAYSERARNINDEAATPGVEARVPRKRYGYGKYMLLKYK